MLLISSTGVTVAQLYHAVNRFKPTKKSLTNADTSNYNWQGRSKKSPKPDWVSRSGNVQEFALFGTVLPYQNATLSH